MHDNLKKVDRFLDYDVNYHDQILAQPNFAVSWFVFLLRIRKVQF
jgi:hypothetical protein